jgi:hypothetical protein
VGDGGAVDFYERLLPARGLRVNHACHDFLAGVTFAAHEHGGRSVGHLLDRHFDFFHLGAGAEQHLEVVVPPYLLAQLSDVADQALLVHHLGDADFEFLGFEGLADVVVGTQFRGLEDERRIGLRGEHDDENVWLDLPDSLQRLNTFIPLMATSSRTRAGSYTGTCGRLLRRCPRC